MKKSILIYILLVISASAIFAQKQKEVIHYNIIFAPDLSNRLNAKIYPKPVNDVDLVEGIFKLIWPNILRAKRSEGQKDKYTIDFINKGLIKIYSVNTNVLTIDFQKFDRQNDRINYIMGRNGAKCTLENDVEKLIKEYKNFNNKASNSSNGADIWTYFQSGIDEGVIQSNIKIGNVNHVFRNILILITDGYIEAGIFNKGYDLSESKISNFRNAFLKSTEKDMATFLTKNQKFKINPVKNKYLKNLEVMVIEMYDRSLSKTGAATKHPTDMEIMKLIWSDWLQKSGVKRFELKATAANKDQGIKSIMNFIMNNN